MVLIPAPIHKHLEWLLVVGGGRGWHPLGVYSQSSTGHPLGGRHTSRIAATEFTNQMILVSANTVARHILNLYKSHHQYPIGYGFSIQNYFIFLCHIALPSLISVDVVLLSRKAPRTNPAWSSRPVMGL